MALILPAVAAPSNPKLLDQVGDVIRRKHYSLRTEHSYKPGLGVKSPLD